MDVHRIKYMKAKLAISTDDGHCYEGEVELTPVRGGSIKPARRKESEERSASDRRFDFTLPLRAFVLANGARQLSGPQKFVLVVGALAKGDKSTGIDVDRVQKEWNKMKAPMGGRFNGAYVTRAKDKGWVEPLKQGVYKLRSTWEEAIRS
jgi:hypothetical protein